MRLALQTDYALRILMFLAVRTGRAHVADVAQFYQISTHHVAKAVNQLARLGYLRGVRGVGGGIELARPPEEIRIGAVVMAFEGNMHLLECVGTAGVCVIQPGCKLKQVFAEAERRQFDYLMEITLRDVLPTDGQIVQLSPPASPAKPRR
jgi:Rrf2 family nitric oxide-sensitive transcriptional repressor